MSGRPPWIWARIVKACAGPVEEKPILTPTEKLVYCELVGLCQTRAGATIGAGALGRRLGLSTRTVERVRKELVTLELLERRDRGQGRTAAWFPTIPQICRPRARRLDDDQLEDFARRLTHCIIGKRAQTPTTADGGATAGGVLRAV
jgi:hypothetical protein